MLRLRVSLRRRPIGRIALLPVAALFAVSVCIPACGSQREGGTGSSPESSWVVTIGSEGGITGGGSGYRIHADGRVESWKRLTAQAEPESTLLGRAPRKEVENLHATLTKTTSLEAATGNRGNMTAFLDWREGQLSKRYTWIDGDAPAAPVATAFEAAMQIVRSLPKNE